MAISLVSLVVTLVACIVVIVVTLRTRRWSRQQIALADAKEKRAADLLRSAEATHQRSLFYMEHAEALAKRATRGLKAWLVTLDGVQELSVATFRFDNGRLLTRWFYKFEEPTELDILSMHVQVDDYTVPISLTGPLNGKYYAGNTLNIDVHLDVGPGRGEVS